MNLAVETRRKPLATVLTPGQAAYMASLIPRRISQTLAGQDVK